MNYSEIGNEKKARRLFTRRTLLVGFAQTALMAGLSGRLYQLQISGASRFRRLADQNRIDIQMFAPTRGSIFDRNGVLLAGNNETNRLVIIPDLAGDLEKTLRLLSRILQLAPDRQRRVMARAGGQNRRIPIHVSSDLSYGDLAKINVMMPELPGVHTEIGNRRIYPQGADFGHLTGFVGAVERFELVGDAAMRLPGMRVGKSGVERSFEPELRGHGGNIKVEINAKGHILRTLERAERADGRDVILSIDARLQRRAMHHVKREKRACVVAMDIRTGEIILMASNPTYDPQKIASGISRTDWNKLLNQPGDPLTNRSIRGQYPPGSTFKMVTALAALEAGVVDPDEKIYCYGSYTHADHTFRCWKRSGHRKMRLHDALRESCDVYFYEIARRTGINALGRMARRLGFGQTYDCGLLEQKSGVIPDEDWKIATFNRGWLEGETILAGIGQGYVLTTPLQLAVMTARIAGGRNVTPTVIKPDPAAPRTAEPLAIDRGHLDHIRRGMQAVVNEAGGTGSNAQLPFAGITVAGKTGTSQVAGKPVRRGLRNREWLERDHGLFVAYFPAHDPRYAVSAVVEHGGSGGRSAAPLARDVMIDLVALDPGRSDARPSAPAPGAGPAAFGKPPGEPT